MHRENSSKIYLQEINSCLNVAAQKKLSKQVLTWPYFILILRLLDMFTER